MGISEERFRDALGWQVRVELTDRAMTQGELAETAGIEPATLNRYLRGHREMPLSIFRKIASVFGLNASELMSLVEARAPREKAEA